ncbi:MAG: putative lipid II flippase FtsW [Actinomycetota bacterium]
MTAVSPRLGAGRRPRRSALGRWLREPQPQPPVFWRVTIMVASLAVLGLLMVLSASSVAAIGSSGSAWSVFLKQGVWLAIGAGAFWLGARIDYRWWQSRALALWIVAVGLCGAVLVPGIGIAVDGGRRWLGVGDIRMQPSELAKLALLVVLAAVLARRTEAVSDPDRIREWAGPVMLLAGFPALLVFLEPDMDSVLVLGFIAAAMLVVSGVPGRILGWTACITAPLLLLAAVLEPYRRERMLAILDPSGHEAASYQTVQSVMAIGRGGLFGVGLGAGRAKWHYLPNAHTDFIFSIIGEELGLFGTLLVLGGFAYLAMLGFRIARSAPERFGALLAAGITVWISGQAVINLGAVVGVFPVAGITLPFLSAGGSSLVVTLLAAGILANIARSSPDTPLTRRSGGRRVAARRESGRVPGRPTSARPAATRTGSRRTSS